MVQGLVVAGKWRELYLNNSKYIYIHIEKEKRKMQEPNKRLFIDQINYSLLHPFQFSFPVIV